jgi:hypothetical protein
MLNIHERQNRNQAQIKNGWRMGAGYCLRIAFASQISASEFTHLKSRRRIERDGRDAFDVLIGVHSAWPDLLKKTAL